MKENKVLLRTKGMAGLLAGVSMTAIEQRAGRFLRAPEHDASDGFQGSGAWATAEPPAAPAKDPAPAPAADTDDQGSDQSDDDQGGGDQGSDQGSDQGDDDQGGDQGDDDQGEQKPKPKKTASERIRELNGRLRENERARDEDRRIFEARIAAVENRAPGSTPAAPASNQGGPEKPNPNDLTKYPLGSLDDRYIEDMIDYAAEKKASAAVDGLLQRQEQTAQQQAVEQQLRELRSKADDVTAKGLQLHDDYEETVVEAGLRGDYKLTQVTFEAAAEAEHGAQILYDLAADKKEAERVASLSPYQQLKYVADKNAEIAGKSQPRRIPKRDQAPPGNQPRGGNSRTGIRGDTDDLDAFEKEFYRKK